MKISVIIPAYNCEDYLPACLDSVIGQTYKNIEIIIVNDGSVDKTATICDQYSKQYDIITVIHQKNFGVSHARNIGMEHITGELVSFIDADDILEPDMYEILLEYMLQYQADIAHCGYKHIVGKEIRLVHDTGNVYFQNREEALKCLVGGHLFVGSLWNKLIKVELLKDVQFHENLKINEDILFAFEVFDRADSSVFVDLAKYNYIAHKGTSAVFSTPDLKKSHDAVFVSKTIYNRLEGDDLQTIARERYLRALCGLYRTVLNDKILRKKIAHEMWAIYRTGPGAGRNMAITSYLIHICPKLYLLIYRVYNYIRKPNWEVK